MSKLAVFSCVVICGMALSTLALADPPPLGQSEIQSAWTQPGVVQKFVGGAPFKDRGLTKQYADVTVQNSAGDCVLNNALFAYKSGRWAVDGINSAQLVSCKTGKPKSGGGMSDGEKAAIGVGAASTAAGIARWGW